MVREAIVLTDEATKERFMFPVNPTSIRVAEGRTFREVPVIALDSVMLAGNLVPVTLSWDGFLPSFYDETICNYRPEKPATSVRRLEKWIGRKGVRQVKPTPLRTVVTGTFFSHLMVITELETEFRGGEPGDVYFTISLQSWRQQTIRIESPSRSKPKKDTRPKPDQNERTYTVRSGDSLWRISKRFYDDGSKWPTIYKANKSVIGPNPNLIHPGQVLVIP